MVAQQTPLTNCIGLDKTVDENDILAECFNTFTSVDGCLTLVHRNTQLSWGTNPPHFGSCLYV